MATLPFRERSNGLVYGQITDQDGNGIDGARFDLILVTIFLNSDSAQRHRSSDNLLADANFSIDDEGNYEWAIKPYETRLFDLQEENGEEHIILLRFVWDSERSGELTGPFDLTDDSDIVTVNHVDHGLAVDDLICFNPPSTVGGLDLGGDFTVLAVVDADTYTFKAKAAANANVTGGGGTVPWYYNGFTDAVRHTLQITTMDLI